MDGVVEEDEHGNEVVGNIIMEALHTDMPDPVQRLDRHLVDKIAVAHDGPRCSHGLDGVQYGKSLWTVPVVVKMEA